MLLRSFLLLSDSYILVNLGQDDPIGKCSKI